MYNSIEAREVFSNLNLLEAMTFQTLNDCFSLIVSDL